MEIKFFISFRVVRVIRRENLRDLPPNAQKYTEQELIKSVHVCVRRCGLRK